MSCKLFTYSVYYILIRYIICEYFLPFCRLPFYFLEAQVFNSDEVQFVYFFPFDAYASGGIEEVVASSKVKRSTPILFSKSFFLFVYYSFTFSKNFIVSLTFRSMIHFELIFV